MLEFWIDRKAPTPSRCSGGQEIHLPLRRRPALGFGGKTAQDMG